MVHQLPAGVGGHGLGGGGGGGGLGGEGGDGGDGMEGGGGPCAAAQTLKPSYVIAPSDCHNRRVFASIRTPCGPSRRYCVPSTVTKSQHACTL